MFGYLTIPVVMHVLSLALKPCFKTNARLSVDGILGPACVPNVSWDGCVRARGALLVPNHSSSNPLDAVVNCK